MCRRILSALLAGLLLIPLAACAPEEGPAAEETPSPSPTATGSPRPTPSLRPSATPEPEPDLSWDEDHTLDRDFTPAAGGKLELPVRGATGYAPVEMGLWPEPQPDPEPEPSPSPEPAGTEPPPADPSPAPSEPVESAPADSPAPTAPGESPPAESGTPADPAPSPAPPPESASPETTPAPAESPAPSPEASPSPAPTPAPSPEPSPEPSATPSPTPSPSADPFEGALMVLEPGTAFTILKEEGDWWQVRCRGETGWVDHRICFINLPDVVPSILYDATNSYDSLYRSAGKALSGVTGESLYPGMTYNPRLGRSEFMMPVLYAMAYRICEAQQAALSEGNSLVIYEAYRPYAAQRAVVKALTALIRSDPEVDAAVNRGPWGPGNFIAMGYSNHQRGFAMDVSLAKVWSTREEQVGDYTVLQVVDYDLYEMPTPMHELSADAVTFTRPTGAWRTAEPAPGMNDPAFALQRYCTDAGMTPLSSEWWHFNDYAARDLAGGRLSVGDFHIGSCVSTAP